MFDRLAGRTTDHTVSGTVPNADGLIPVNPSRFQVGVGVLLLPGRKLYEVAGEMPFCSQVLRIDTKISIKDFVQKNSLLFKTGRGFYEFTKPETVSHKKEVVLVDKVCTLTSRLSYLHVHIPANRSPSFRR